MTDTPATTPVEDITDAVDTASARLSRQADAILDETAVRPLRTAIRADVVAARDWGYRKAGSVRAAVRTEPIRATLYALGLGVVIGLVAAR